MHEQEARALDRCLDCGASIDASAGRSFAFGEDGLLCWQCAERRGGSYDELHDRWMTEPDVSDLLRYVQRQWHWVR